VTATLEAPEKPEPTPVVEPSRVRKVASRVRPFEAVGGLFGLVLVVLVIVPIAYMLEQAFVSHGSVSLTPFRRALALTDIDVAARNTVILIVVGGAVAMVVGTFFAWLNERTDAKLGWLGTALPLAPLLLPQVAMSIGWVFLASPNTGYLNVLIRRVLAVVGIHMKSGPFNIYSWYGMIFLYALEMVPYVFLVMTVGLRNLDSSMDEASRSCGATAFQTLWRVSIPAIRPAIGASFFIMVMIGLSTYSAPVIVGQQAGIDVMSVRIVSLLQASFPPDTPAATALSIFILAGLAVAWFLQRLIAGRHRSATIGGKATVASRVKLGHWRWPAKALVWVFLAATCLAPLISVLLVSLQPYWSAHIAWSHLSFNGYRQILSGNIYSSRVALKTSIELGLIVATIGTVLTLAILVEARRAKRLVQRTLQGIVRLPAAFPPVILALSLIVLLAGGPFFLYGTETILVIGYLLFHITRTAIVVESSLDQVGTDLEEASKVSGAGRGQTFLRVQLPLVTGGVAVGWALFFVAVIGDLTGSVMLSTAQTPVVGVVILNIFSNGTFPPLAAMTIMVTIISAVFVFLALFAAARRQKWGMKITSM
jgi:iron(III) transport system permease protein